MSKFNEFLCKSENLRKGYSNSLEVVDVNYKKKWLEYFEKDIPIFFEDIYSICNGTKGDISEQVFFDFIPGYRLMQVDEILTIYEERFKGLMDNRIIIPFLTDYSGCYYAYTANEKKEGIVLVSNEGIELIHSEIKDFWNTIIAFYDEKVYFLDEEGYLSYDFDKEGEIGKKYNEGVEYWE